MTRKVGSFSAVTLALAIGVFVAVASAQELPFQKFLPLELAREAASAALAACEAKGYRVSVAVVDGGGHVKVLIKGDGAGPHTLDSSRR